MISRIHLCLIIIKFVITSSSDNFFESTTKDANKRLSDEFFGDITKKSFILKSTPDRNLNFVLDEVNEEKMDLHKQTSPKQNFLTDPEDMKVPNELCHELNNVKDSLIKVYFSRFVNIFLRKIGIWENDSENESEIITIGLKLSKRDITVLKNFGSGSDVSFEALEDSFISLFAPIPEDPISLGYSFSLENIEMLKYFVVCILFPFVLFKTMKFQFKSLLLLIVITLYSVIVSIHLYNQYENVSDKILLQRKEFDGLDGPPDECFLSKMSYLQKLMSHISGDNVCERYLESRKSAWNKIDVTSALIEPIHDFFMKIFTLLGVGSTRLIKPITDECPWPLNVILFPILSVLQIPLVAYLLFCLVFRTNNGNISLKMPFFGWVLTTSTNTKEKVVEKKSAESLEGFNPNKSICNNCCDRRTSNFRLHFNQMETSEEGFNPNKSIRNNCYDRRTSNFQLDFNQMETSEEVTRDNNTEVPETDSLLPKKLIFNQQVLLTKGFINNVPSQILESKKSESTKSLSTFQQSLNEKMNKTKNNKCFKRINPRAYNWDKISSDILKDFCQPHHTN